ncbi:MAG: acyl-CoA dehydrogenase, partial [Acidimicrobiaceae bacterium]|nr:acyl-CoA dehydrogenase [Acidimicrobiaceae bacterium]
MTGAASAPTATEADAATVRSEVEAFCDEHWDPDATVEQWWRLLAGAGYAHPMLPPGAGG